MVSGREDNSAKFSDAVSGPVVKDVVNFSSVAVVEIVVFGRPNASPYKQKRIFKLMSILMKLRKLQKRRSLMMPDLSFYLSSGN